MLDPPGHLKSGESNRTFCHGGSLYKVWGHLPMLIAGLSADEFLADLRSTLAL